MLPKIDIIQFLKCYEKRPCLWDPNEEDYRYNTDRLEALKSIIEEMGLTVTVQDLRTKIKNIRTTYHRELSKIAESMKSGADPDNVYKPQLSWFPVADRFLRPTVELKNGKDYSKIDVENPPKTASSSSSSEEKFNPEPPKKKMKCTPARKRARKNIPTVVEAVTQSELPTNTNQDEFDTFGQHVANQLRGLPLKNAIVCQNFINNFLSRQRIKVLEVQTSVYIPMSRRRSSVSECKYDPSSSGP